MTVTAVFACVGSPVEREKVSSMKASSYCTSIRLTLRDVTVTNLFLPCFVLGHFSIFFFFVAQTCLRLSSLISIPLYACLSSRERAQPPLIFSCSPNNGMYPLWLKSNRQRFMVETRGLSSVQIQSALTKKAGFRRHDNEAPMQSASV